MPSRYAHAMPYADKLEAIRKGRGQTYVDVARQLGVHVIDLRRIFHGEMYPGYETAERIRWWALENRDYSGSPRIKTARQIQAERGKWSQLTWRFPKRLHQRLRTVCNQWRMSQSTFVQLAVERLLDNEGALKGYEMAAKRVAKARLTQAMVEAPGIVDVLECELPWAIKIGGRLGPKAHTIQPVNPVNAVEALNVDSTGAVSQDIWWPDDDVGFEEDAGESPGESGEDT